MIMRFNDLFKRLFNRSETQPPVNGKFSPEALKMMVYQLEHTQETELSCDEVLALLDQFAEAHLRGEDVSRLMPLIQHHLEMCQDCREEFEALLRILQAEPG
jgi:predicted component of type VI protein secretion system